MRVINLIGL